MPQSSQSLDLNNNGIITEEEVRLQNIIMKTETQAQIAKWALIAMIIITLLVFAPIFPDSRILILSDLLTLFYISMAGIIGAFMGVSGWMAVKGKNTEVKGNGPVQRPT